MFTKPNARMSWIYSSIIFWAVLLSILSIIFVESEKNENTDIFEIEPVHITETDQNTVTYCFNLTSLKFQHRNLVFFTKHQLVKIYSDGSFIFENSNTGGIFGHTTGSEWNFVTVPTSAASIYVEFTQAYDSVELETPTFYVGDKLDIYMMIFKSSLPAMFLCLLIIIIGIVLIIYHSIMGKKQATGKYLLYLGIMAIVFGSWSFNETNGATLLLRPRPAYSFIAYILLICLTTMAVLFTKEFLNRDDKYFWKLLCITDFIMFTLLIIMQILNVRDIRENLKYIHILLILSILYIVGTYISKIIKKQYSTSLKFSFAGICVLFLSAMVDFLSYYFSPGENDSDIAGRIGFILFILLMAFDATHNSLLLIEKGKQSEFFMELAVTDKLTGVRNRNAYMIDIQKIKDFTNHMIITFDLNNLKICNDTMGHNEGDAYIANAAGIIHSLFGQYGICYRIGGDEFCVLVENADTIPIGELLFKLEEKEKEYNLSRDDGFNMQIATGYAVFSDILDKNIEDTRERADAMMYKNKNFIKTHTI